MVCPCGVAILASETQPSRETFENVLIPGKETQEKKQTLHSPWLLELEVTVSAVAENATVITPSTKRQAGTMKMVQQRNLRTWYMMVLHSRYPPEAPCFWTSCYV